MNELRDEMKIDERLAQLASQEAAQAHGCEAVLYFALWLVVLALVGAIAWMISPVLVKLAGG